MRNLLAETKRKLLQHGYNEVAVRWIGSRSGRYTVSWGDFVRMADQEYDDDFGPVNVAGDLVVVGDDWWLERHEYDGKEWWEFKTLPRVDLDAQPFRDVFVRLIDKKRGVLWQ